MSKLRERIVALRNQYQAYVDNPSTEGHFGLLFTIGTVEQVKSTIANLDAILAECPEEPHPVSPTSEFPIKESDGSVVAG